VGLGTDQLKRDWLHKCIMRLQCKDVEMKREEGYLEENREEKNAKKGEDLAYLFEERCG